MTHVDLQALADMPGAGNAHAVLQKSGHWNEALGDGPGWWCTVDGTIRAQTTFMVYAANAEEARKKAMKIAHDQDDVSWDFSAHDVEPTFATAIEAEA